MPEASILQFPLRAGVDEGKDPKALPPGTLTRLENCVQTKEGLISKRYGTLGMSKTKVGGGTVSTGKRLVVRGDELSMCDGTDMLVYNEGLDLWRAADRAPALTMKWRPVVDAVRTVRDCNIAYYNGWLCLFYSVDGGSQVPCMVQIIDATTWATVLAPTLVTSTGGTPSVLVRGTKLILLWRNTTVGVKYRELDLTTLAFVAAEAVLPEASTGYGVLATTQYAAQVDGTKLYVVTELSAGVNRLHMAILDTSYAATSTANVASEANTGFDSISISVTAGEYMYIAYDTSSGSLTRLTVRDPSNLAQVTAPLTVAAVKSRNVWVVRYSATQCLYGWSADTASLTTGQLTTYVISSAGVTDATTTRSTPHCRTVIAPWKVDGRWYCGVMHNSDGTLPAGNSQPQQSVAVLEIQTDNNVIGAIPHRTVATLEPRITPSAWLWVSTSMMVQPAVVSSTRAVIVTAFETQTARRGVFASFNPQAFDIVDVQGIVGDTLRPITIGGDSFLACASPSYWDGSSCLSSGFWLAPFLRAKSSGAGSIAAGTYLHCLVAEVRTASGLLIRSIPSSITSSTVGAASSIIQTIYPANVDGRCFSSAGWSASAYTSVRIAAYRSTVGQSTLYRLTCEPSSNVITNDPTVDTLTFTDTVADANIDGGGTALNTRPVIYTSGGVLDDAQPPPFLTCVFHKGRIWGLSGDELTVWASKVYGDDPRVAPGFSEGLTLRFDRRKTALVSLDEKLVALGANSIDIVLGDGPTVSGAQSDWTVQSIQTDVGCTNARSVATTPAGAVFQSSRGIELLSRGLEVTWIGRPVKDQLAAFPTITSAVVVPAQGQVRFSCNNTAGTSGIVLVWDYVNGTWSTFKYYDTDTSTASCPIADAVLWRDRYTLLTPGGKAYQESATTYLDGASHWVTLLAETGWIFADGPLGFQRVRRVHMLGDNITPHDLTLAFGFDHSASYAQSYTWTSGQIATIADGDNVGMRVGSQNGANPRCRAFRVKVSDATPSVFAVGTGAGAQFSAIGLEIIPKPGMGRRSARAEA